MIRGYFPDDMPPVCGTFEVISMLAVLEHFTPARHPNLAKDLQKILRPGGLLLITVPSVAVDEILEVLLKLRLIHGMSRKEHHGYEVEHKPRILAEPAFKLLIHKQFQLYLNNLFGFQ